MCYESPWDVLPFTTLKASLELEIRNSGTEF